MSQGLSQVERGDIYRFIEIYNRKSALQAGGVEFERLDYLPTSEGLTKGSSCMMGDVGSSIFGSLLPLGTKNQDILTSAAQIVYFFNLSLTKSPSFIVFRGFKIMSAR